MPSLSEKFREMFSIVNKKYMNDRVGNILAQCTSSDKYIKVPKINIITPRGGFKTGEIYVNFKLQEFDKPNKDNRIYSYGDIIDSAINRQQEKIQNEYRKFIEENRYGRIEYRGREISIPRIQCAQSNGNNIKYASRRLLDDMGK